MSQAPQVSAFDRVLVPLDGSQSSLEAVSAALAIARNAHRLTLLYVAPHEGVAGDGALDQLNDERTALSTDHPGMEVDLEVGYGDAVEGILDAAQRLRPDLIVMCQRESGAAPRDPDRITSCQVATQAEIPVMVVHADSAAASKLRRIVVPLDGSLRATQSLPIATNLARSLDLPVHLVTVIDPVASLPPAYAYSSPELDADRRDALASLQFQGNQALNYAVRELGCAGITPTADLLSGPTHKTLLGELKEGDILVLTTRGDGRPEHRVGRLARALVVGAPVPVIMFHSALATTVSLCGMPDWEASIAASAGRD